MKKIISIFVLSLISVSIYAMKDTVKGALCSAGNFLDSGCKASNDKSQFCKDIDRTVEKHCTDRNGKNDSKDSHAGGGAKSFRSENNCR